jgi:hypothetical protein
MQHLDAFDHLHMAERLRQHLQEAGEDPSLLSMQTEATVSRWTMHEATMLAYQDIFLLASIIVLLTTVPVLWLRQRRAAA